MLQKGNIFLEKMMTARDKIATKGAERLPDNSVRNTYTKYYFCLKKKIKLFFLQKILVHSRSRTVLATLKEAHNMHKRLYVYVTECSANKSGSLMKKNLDDLGIPCQVVLDASVGYVLEKVDLVLFGAEGVVESGGICNKVSIYSYQKL